MNVDVHLLGAISSYTQGKITDLLYKKNILQAGKVTRVQKKIEDATLVSYIVIFDLTYSEDAIGLLEKQLILKVGKPHIGGMDHQREVLFYSHILKEMECSPAPLCLEAVYDDNTDISQILMVSLKNTHTHLQADYPLLPSNRQCEQVIRKLARFHAFWWDSPLLQQPSYQAQQLSVNEQSKGLHMLYQSFAEAMQDRLDESVLHIYKQVLNKLDPLLELIAQRCQTLIHGDAHFGNVLAPITEDGETYLIDWSDWQPGAAMEDLAYMLAVGYFPNQRKKIEWNLFDIYHNELAALGISYEASEAFTDYKLCIVKNLFVPLFQWQHQVPANIWYYNFERVTAAFQDLHCSEVVDRL